MLKQKMMYSQNLEEQVITDYFKGFKGTLLDIGANDGKTFSNSLRLIELGWKAILVEPSQKAFEKLEDLHEGNMNVILCKTAIGVESGFSTLHESGHHLPDKSDISLLSTIKPSEKARWKNVEFEERETMVMDYATFCDCVGVKKFDFITIDAEGLDFEILSQIDLTHTKLVCVETNGIETHKYIEYCQKFGMKLIHRNAENIIMAKWKQ